MNGLNLNYLFFFKCKSESETTFDINISADE